MDEVQTSRYGFRWQKRKCVDCGKEFIAKAAKSVRCLDCRAEHAREQARKWQRENKGKEPKEPPVKNPDICTKPVSCKYGTTTGGLKHCDYLMITGHKRPCRAGECTVYTRKTERKKKS